MQATVYVNKTWFRIYSTFMHDDISPLIFDSFYFLPRRKDERGGFGGVKTNPSKSNLQRTFFPNILNVSVVNPLCFTA